MYTTMRELVENSLDAAEAIGVLPFIEILIEELTQEELNSMRGIKVLDREPNCIKGATDSALHNCC